MGVSEAVPDVGLAVKVVELPVQGQRAPARGQGFVVLAELGVVPADVVERVGLTADVGRAAAQPQRATCAGQRGTVPAPVLQQPAEVLLYESLADIVAMFLVTFAGVLELRVCLIEQARTPVRQPETVVSELDLRFGAFLSYLLRRCVVRPVAW